MQEGRMKEARDVTWPARPSRDKLERRRWPYSPERLAASPRRRGYPARRPVDQCLVGHTARRGSPDPRSRCSRHHARRAGIHRALPQVC
jgi:hypothetical protein